MSGVSQHNYFNPRSPWGERPANQFWCDIYIQFQSTLPVGGATRKSVERLMSIRNFNPRSPWGERQNRTRKRKFERLFQSTLPVGGATQELAAVSAGSAISIHAPRGGSDFFQFVQGGAGGISIHAPRGGSDGGIPKGERIQRDFNPRSPWGERLSYTA